MSQFHVRISTVIVFIINIADNINNKPINCASFHKKYSPVWIICLPGQDTWHPANLCACVCKARFSLLQGSLLVTHVMLQSIETTKQRLIQLKLYVRTEAQVKPPSVIHNRCTLSQMPSLSIPTNTQTAHGQQATSPHMYLSLFFVVHTSHMYHKHPSSLIHSVALSKL